MHIFYITQFDILIILRIGFSEQIDKKKAEEMGISSFVMKPIVMGELPRQGLQRNTSAYDEIVLPATSRPKHVIEAVDFCF